MDTGIGGKYTFSDGTPAHICRHFMFIANKCSGLHFASNGSIFVEIVMVGAGIFVNSAVQGHPRPLPLVPIESAYAASY